MEISPDGLLDLAQSFAIVVVMGIFIWAVLRATRFLITMIKGQQKLVDEIRTLWRRIDEIELRQGLRGDAVDLARLKRLSDALANGLKDMNGKQGPP